MNKRRSDETSFFQKKRFTSALNASSLLILVLASELLSMALLTMRLLFNATHSFASSVISHIKYVTRALSIFVIIASFFPTSDVYLGIWSTTSSVVWVRGFALSDDPTLGLVSGLVITLMIINGTVSVVEYFALTTMNKLNLWE